MVIDSNLSFCTVKKLLAISHSLFIARIHRDRQIVLRQFRLCVGLPYGELYAFRKPVGTIKKRQISGRQFFRKNIDGFALSAQKIRKAKCGAQRIAVSVYMRKQQNMLCLRYGFPNLLPVLHQHHPFSLFRYGFFVSSSIFLAI